MANIRSMPRAIRRSAPPALTDQAAGPKEPRQVSTKPGPEVPYASMEEALAKDAEPGFFLSKKLTPEVEQFSKDRNIIQQNMDRTATIHISTRPSGSMSTPSTTSRLPTPAPQRRRRLPRPTLSGWPSTARRRTAPSCRRVSGRGQGRARQRQLVLTWASSRRNTSRSIGEKARPRRVQKRVRRHDVGDDRRRCALRQFPDVAIRQRRRQAGCSDCRSVPTRCRSRSAGAMRQGI